jgi:hypothetical protein
MQCQGMAAGKQHLSSPPSNYIYILIRAVWPERKTKSTNILGNKSSKSLNKFRFSPQEPQTQAQVGVKKLF